jgi:hypothetical protein
VAIARRRLGDLLARPAGAALAFGLAFLHPEPARPAGRVELRAITGFSAEYDTLWERCRGGYSMCVRRDRVYLNWKYVACPTRRYEIREARKDGVLSGFAVARHEDHGGLRLGWLIDVFAHPGDHETKDALIGGLLAELRDAGVARAQAFSMNAALAGDLMRWGFLCSRSPMQFCVRAKDGARDVFKDLGRWHVVFGDSDMDR